ALDPPDFGQGTHGSVLPVAMATAHALRNVPLPRSAPRSRQPAPVCRGAVPVMSETVPTVMHLIDTAGPGGAETVFAQLAKRLQHGSRSIAVVPREDWLTGYLR